MTKNQSINSLINFKDKSFINLIQEYNYSFNSNDIIAGTIVSKEAYGMLINIGSTKTALVPAKEISLNSAGNPIELNVNETREFVILGQSITKNYIILSIRRLDYMRAWKRIKIMQEEEILIEGSIISYNKGGGLIYLEGLLGFVPNSHLLEQDIKYKYSNNKVPLKLLEVNKQDNRLTLSNRCAVLSKNLENFTIGKKVKGFIEEIKPYGLFIKVGKIKGLLHRSEIKKSHTTTLNEIFKIGNEIEVDIIHVDLRNGRVSFSIKTR
uniref:Small ribosomal subunit protein bS1c n=1 Tax=Flintiella sanguinaria TaxID=101926 RepID=A0A1X9PUI6_9RHOD|nr:30S ribosomal protein S1 [Flintiella sanguinaria]